MGLFSRFCVRALRFAADALDIPDVYVFKTSQNKKTWVAGPGVKTRFALLSGHDGKRQILR
jgi:hypothetical protein